MRDINDKLLQHCKGLYNALDDNYYIESGTNEKMYIDDTQYSVEYFEKLKADIAEAERPAREGHFWLLYLLLTAIVVSVILCCIY